MSVSSHENRKSRSSSGSMNIHLFHKPGHADSLLTHLNLLRKRHLFTDVVLRAGNRAFHCHRAVLASCSRYFEAMFSGGLKESRDAEVNFHDSLHPEVLELLLDYAYSARVLINEENAESLLEAGDMLQFQDIRDASADFLEKNLYPGNCLNMLLLSDAHCCQRLLELSWRMALANFTSLCKSEDFLRLPKDKLVELVESEELEVEDETLVYEAVMGWIRYDLPRRHEVLPELLRSVRLALLPEPYLRKHVACEQLGTPPGSTCRPESPSAEEPYVVGGYCGAQRCKTLDCYDPSSDTWRSVTTVPYSLIPTAFVSTWKQHQRHLPEMSFHVTVLSPWAGFVPFFFLGSHIIVIGGDTEFSASSAYRFHSDTSQWSKFGDVTAKRISCRAVTSGNRLYVVGGYCGAQRCKTLDCYDPSSDTWRSVTTVPYSLIPTAFVSTWKYLSA
ncbi:PREDICTED: kelch-like protein 25 [Chaetura pelagica]|uniref:kelch-like protein 25 n=1 Tax=Chaetura pelagica TaxID=8897 RepID=UPI000523C429|nr:PREDICTED: kelch-like protein 25 [Chaetura pelagica]